MRDKSYSSEKAYYVTTFDGYPDQYYLIRLPRLQESPFLPHGAMVIEGLREKQGLGDPTTVPEIKILGQRLRRQM